MDSFAKLANERRMKPPPSQVLDSVGLDSDTRRRGRKGIFVVVGGAKASVATRFWWAKVKAKLSSSCRCICCAPRALSLSSGVQRSKGSGRSPDSCSTPQEPGADADMSYHQIAPAELGCVHHHLLHGQQQQDAPHMQPESACGRTKTMRKFDRDMVASILMLTLGMNPSPSGTMFMGKWVSDQGLEVPVAIKVFHHHFSAEAEKRVSKQLKAKVVLRHRNLLCPLGYGFMGRKLHLFYDYMVNGSLDQHLFATQESSRRQDQQPQQRTMDPLSWARRWSIINGVAAALLHLHSNGAVHGSVKSSNVLLDQDMTVRLGDFAYSGAPYTVSLSDTAWLGLPPECCPPEIVTFPVTEPTFARDVFCFGTVILEVVCARKTSHGLVDWVRELHDADNIIGAVDKTLLPAAAAGGDEADSDSLQRVLLLGLACSHPDPSERPKMEDVVNVLEGSAPLPLVPSKDRAAAAAHAHPLCFETESPERQQASTSAESYS